MKITTTGKEEAAARAAATKTTTITKITTAKANKTIEKLKLRNFIPKNGEGSYILGIQTK